MINWRCVVNFKKFWKKEIQIEEKGKLAAIELKKILPKIKDNYENDELSEIIEMFECVSGDGEPEETTEFTPTEDFDERMYDLYEWADRNRVWIKTII
jgi:hypothetical protein